MAVSKSGMPESSLVDETMFPSNSKQSKEKIANDDIPHQERKTDKIIKGSVSTRKHTVASDMTDRFSKFAKDTIFPAVKDAAVDMFKRWIDVMVYGEERSRSGRSGSVGEGRQYVSYSGYYQQNNRNYRSTTRNDFNDISRNLDDQVFDRKSDAEEVLGRLKEDIRYYDREVSVATFFDYIGKTTPFTANKFGWTNLDDAYVTRVNDGWLIEFPEPEVLR